jgi:hypothetical protein
MNEKALEKILNIFLKEVLPLTEQGVAKGSKIFDNFFFVSPDFNFYFFSNFSFSNNSW